MSAFVGSGHASANADEMFHLPRRRKELSARPPITAVLQRRSERQRSAKGRRNRQRTFARLVNPTPFSKLLCLQVPNYPCEYFLIVHAA